MNFYSVKIGKATRKGGFNESHSFVCESELSEMDIRKHWTNHYVGFNVEVSPVLKIEQTVINGTSYKKEIKEYETKIQRLERRVENGIEIFKGVIHASKFDSKIDQLYSDYNKLKNIANEKLKECGNAQLSKLQRENINFTDRVELESFEGGYFRYKMRLKGKLIKE